MAPAYRRAGPGGPPREGKGCAGRGPRAAGPPSQSYEPSSSSLFKRSHSSTQSENTSMGSESR